MGFKWRKNAIEGSEEPSVVTSGVDVVSTNPEGDLKQFKKLHKWDPFLEVEKLDDVDRVLETGDLEKEAAVEATLLTEDSPYPEVRASVRSSPSRMQLSAMSRVPVSDSSRFLPPTTRICPSTLSALGLSAR